MVKFLNGLVDWFEERLPLKESYEKHLTQYYAPKNLNFWYFFGFISTLMLANQVFTGIWLAMHYIPSETEAFNSIEQIMREVEWGWLIRYMHTVGASFLFISIYFHMMRAFLYGSYKRPRELVWLLGMLLFLALMAEAFMGYVLPWGQMSYWGAQVVTSLFSILPYGDSLVQWIRGDYLVSGATLSRFYAMHLVLVPLVILVLLVLHFVALRRVGSSNPEGTELNKKEIKASINSQRAPSGSVPFHPYYTVKDLFGLVAFLIPFSLVVFFFPEGGGYILEPANFEPANSLSTPEHIVPLWYFGAFFAMLRAIPDTFLGVIVMASAIAILFVLPWLDRSPVRSWRYKGWLSKVMILVFGCNFVLLTWLGSQSLTPLFTWMSRAATLVYFSFFLLMPIYSRLGNTSPSRQQEAGV